MPSLSCSAPKSHPILSHILTFFFRKACLFEWLILYLSYYQHFCHALMHSLNAKQDYGWLIQQPPVYGFYFTAGKWFTLLPSISNFLSITHSHRLSPSRSLSLSFSWDAHVNAGPHIQHLCKRGGGGGRQCKSEENHLCPALNLSQCWFQRPGKASESFMWHHQGKWRLFFWWMRHCLHTWIC